MHDAWLYYLVKTGNDLFSIELRNENQYLYTVIKYAFYRWVYHERKKSVIRHTEWLEEGFNSSDSPLEEVYKNDLHAILYDKLLITLSNLNHPKVNKKLPVQIFELKSQDYDDVSIAEQLNTSKQLVGQYVHKINHILKDVSRE